MPNPKLGVNHYWGHGETVESGVHELLKDVHGGLLDPESAAKCLDIMCAGGGFSAHVLTGLKTSPLVTTSKTVGFLSSLVRQNMSELGVVLESPEVSADRALAYSIMTDLFNQGLCH